MKAWVVLVMALLAVSSAAAACIGGSPNGVVEPPEECDDGNTVNGDGCSNSCFAEGEADRVMTDLALSHNMLFSKVMDLTHITKHEAFQTESKEIQMALIRSYDRTRCEVLPMLFALPASTHPHGKLEEVNAFNDFWIQIAGDESGIGVLASSIAAAQALQDSAEVEIKDSNFLTAAQLKCCAYNQLILDSDLTWKADTNTCSVCGDGIVDAGEECDDGNNINGDGCSANCITETGDPICGNGEKEGSEECDDGNTLNGDGCSSVCTKENGGPRPGPGGGSNSHTGCPFGQCTGQVEVPEPVEETPAPQEQTETQVTQTQKKPQKEKPKVECKKDKQCNPGFVCVENKCVQKEQPEPESQEEESRPVVSAAMTGGLSLLALLLLLVLMFRSRPQKRQMPVQEPEEPVEKPQVHKDMEELEQAYARIDEMLKRMRRL